MGLSAAWVLNVLSFFCLLRVVVPVHQVLGRGLPGLHPTLTPQTPPKVEGRWQWTPAVVREVFCRRLRWWRGTLKAHSGRFTAVGRKSGRGRHVLDSAAGRRHSTAF